MRANICWIFLHVCIWAGLLLTLNADEECLIETRVHVNTSYEAVVGEQFKIECGVAFCEEAPPTVDWIKREQTDVPVNVRSSSRIQTQWEFIDKLEGISILTFHKVRLTDSGVYQCQSGGSSSHNINVFVNVDDGRWRRTTVPQKNEKECLIETKVHEDTSYEAVVGEQFKIECGVAFCEEAPPTVDWIKREQTDVPVNVSSSRIQTQWEFINKSEGISILTFHKIRLNDSGVYQCKSGGSSSHNINVFVNVDDGRGHTTVPQKNESSTRSGPKVNSWTYMYFAAGIVPFIIIVIIISVVSMRGCEGKSKKETSRENQYMAIPMVEQPLHHGHLQPSPRGSSSAPPCRRSLRIKPPPLEPNELPLPRDNGPVYRVITRDRERQRNTAEEEGSSIVYAALNHQLPARAARPPRPTEEQSDYAAIRVQE